MVILPEKPVKHAAISGATLDDNTLVAAVEGKRIRVLGLVLVAAGSVVATLYSGASATGTMLTGAMSMAVGEKLVLTPAVGTSGWMESEIGEALVMKLSAAVQVGGMLTYVEVG